MSRGAVTLVVVARHRCEVQILYATRDGVLGGEQMCTVRDCSEIEGLGDVRHDTRDAEILLHERRILRDDNVGRFEGFDQNSSSPLLP